MKKIITLIAILLLAFPLTVESKKGGNPSPPPEPVECQSGEFQVEADAPPGWIVTLDNPCLSLAPGATGVTGLKVTSPKNAKPGFYVIPVRVLHPAGSEYDSISSVTIYIEPRGRGKK